MLTVYLIHFTAKYEHAQHYLGLSKDLPRRLEEHRSGEGNPLLKAVTNAGISWELCPICNPQSWQHNATH